MKTSVRERFVFTIGANLFRSSLSFATGILLARCLGPVDYGNMAFLLGTFVGIQQLLDMGSSNAFFTFLSQQPRSKRFVWTFFLWLATQFIILLCVIGLLFPSRWIEVIWRGQPRGLVLIAFAAAFMQNSAWPVMQQAGESQRQTRWVQGIGAIVGGVHLLAVVTLWWLGLLGLYAIFAAIVLEYCLAMVVAHRRFSYAKGGDVDLSGDAPGSILRKFFHYCSPLIIYVWVGFAYYFADDWLLQVYGGSVQQAYYAVGAQFASVALIATSSILRIFWKEIAESHHRGDHVRTGLLYKKVSRLLFLIGAIIAGFLMPWAKDLLSLILGAAYVGGAMTMTIMFLYPVHQSLGQIVGTMLYATEHVSIQVITGIVFMITSMGVAYLVLAPRGAAIPGLGLGSEGLALKMVAMQFIQVNAVAFIISRIFRWPFDWAYQPISLLGCVGLGWMAHGAATALIAPAAVALAGHHWSVLVVMSVAGIFYLTLIMTFVYALPWLAGLTRVELVSNVGTVRRKLGVVFG